MSAGPALLGLGLGLLALGGWMKLVTRQQRHKRTHR